MSDPENDDPPVRRAERRQPVKVTRDRSQLPLAIVAVLAIVAIALSAWALLKPATTGSTSGDASGSFSDTQRAEAKAKICAAFPVVVKGVTQNTNLVVPGGPEDTIGTMSVAANARLALYNGGAYLLARLDPATPPELADNVRSFANNLLDVGAAATAGALNTDPDQAARLRAVDSANANIVRLCA